MAAFGGTKKHRVEDSKGNTLTKQTIEFYPTQADAQAGTNIIGTTKIDVEGDWTFDTSYGEVWCKIQDYGIWKETDLSSTFDAAVAGQKKSKVKTDGTDQTATLQAELDALVAAGGGTLLLPAGTVRIAGQIVLPTTGSGAAVKMNAVRLVGQGGYMTGKWSDVPYGGTALDLRYAGADAKIVTLGSGSLELAHLTLLDDGAANNTPFILTTNTTLNVHDCAFHGNPTKDGTTADQDAIILGGTAETLSGGTTASPFQGYGTIIRRNYFSRVRRAVWARVYANGVVIRENVVSLTCGGPAAFEVQGPATDWTQGVVLAENLVECHEFDHAILFSARSQKCYVAGNTFWDTGGAITSFIHLATGSTGHILIAGYHDGFVPFVTADYDLKTSGKNIIIDTNSGADNGAVFGGIGIGGSTTDVSDAADVFLRRASGSLIINLSGYFAVKADAYIGTDAVNVRVGNSGTTSAWLDASGTNANIDLSLRAKGASLIKSMSGHRFEKQVVRQPRNQTLAAAGGVTIDASAGSLHRVTLNANATTMSITNTLAQGEELVVAMVQDATGGRTYAWPSNCRFAGGSAPSDTTANTTTVVTFRYAGSVWQEAGRVVAVPNT